MADAELNILIKARNQAKGEFDKLNKQVSDLQGKGTSSGFAGLNKKIGDFSTKFQGATGMSLGFASAAGLATLATQQLIKFTREAITEYAEYGDTVDKMARLTGNSVEQTSQLIQVTDDLFISTETLNTALEAATRKGINTSIDGIKKLSEQYLKLNPGVERGKFLMDNFGRSGADMGRLLELGADGIQQNMDAVSKWLIVTQDSKQKALEYKQSVDALNDAFTGVKMRVADEVIPVITDLNTIFADLIEKTNEAEIRNSSLGETIKMLLTASFYPLVKYYELLYQGIHKWAEKIRETKPDIESQNGNLEIQAGKLSTVTQYFRDLTTEMIFNHIAATMDAEAQMQLALRMGLINGETYITLTSLDELTAKYDINKDGVIELTEQTTKYWQDLQKIQGYQDSLKDKTVTYTINIREVHTSTNLSADQEHNPYIGLPETNRASGGPASGMTWVGERGPELLSLPPGSRVYSNQQSMGMAGQSAPVINVYYSTVFGLSDRTKAVNELRPIFEELSRGR